MASPFSCDKIFVFEPSARSHKMIVPSTDAEAKTPPWEILTAWKNSFYFVSQTKIENREKFQQTNCVKSKLNASGAQCCYFNYRSLEPNGAAIDFYQKKIQSTGINCQIQSREQHLHYKRSWNKMQKK